MSIHCRRLKIKVDLKNRIYWHLIDRTILALDSTKVRIPNNLYLKSRLNYLYNSRILLIFPRGIFFIDAWVGTTSFLSLST